ncbi:hypothetical protein B0T26DRAFT_680804 [Lasiosphaeria miniovina]|uniref:RRM domain-containing protein n=1 Tax=Lasiosphaeria miniovina TaxID=1954250 RepID=A0AA39ZSU3_9PEZI|nr:uncharacterized protein B0T26DRAFT_680804 [Lasiosphaeria miniovina]KAK0703051.1 hypothetical protein B0T26DRAFT_680804 [Lasiosphaeria miniovina]
MAASASDAAAHANPNTSATPTYTAPIVVARDRENWPYHIIVSNLPDNTNWFDLKDFITCRNLSRLNIFIQLAKNWGWIQVIGFSDFVLVMTVLKSYSFCSHKLRIIDENVEQGTPGSNIIQGPFIWTLNSPLPPMPHGVSPP